MKVHEVQNNTGAHQKSMGPKTTLDPTESEWGPKKNKKNIGPYWKLMVFKSFDPTKSKWGPKQQWTPLKVNGVQNNIGPLKVQKKQKNIEPYWNSMGSKTK